MSSIYAKSFREFKCDCPDLSGVQEEGKKDFNFDGRIDFVMKDILDPKIYHMYSF